LLPIIAVYAVLIAALVVLYFVSQKRRTGPRQGFFEWLKSGFSGPTAASSLGTPPGAAADGEDAAEVVAVLEDLYEEFMGEIANLKQAFEARIDQLEREHQDQLEQIRSELARLREEVASGALPWQRLISARGATDEVFVSAEGVEPADSEWAEGILVEDTSHTSVQLVGNSSAKLPSERYFEILDELQTGKSPQEIAEQLGVSVEDVEQVKRIMESPALAVEP
jgi:hypothetical protein